MMGPAPGQQLVQHRSQRVDVGSRGDRFAPHLLRRRVLRGEEPILGERHQRLQAVVGRLRLSVAAHHLRDPEIEQLYLPVLGYQDVARLEVTVDHQVLVGIAYRLGHLKEEPEPVVDTESARLGVGDDGDALDVLDGEVRLPLVADPTVEQPGDVGVAQPGEDLALGQETAVDPVGVDAVSDQLEGDLLPELAVGPLGEIDDAHPPAGELADDSVGADDAAHRVVLRRRRAGEPPAVQLEEAPGRGVGLEQPLHVPAELRIGAVLGEPPRPLLGRQLERGVEEPVGFMPVEPGGRHDASSW
jgi:hypothetical protein